LRVSYFGTIAHYKGVDIAIDAVLGSQERIELSIRGRTSDFPDYSGPLVERSKKDSRVRFDGPFPRELLGAALAETAFAAGVPVFAANLGGMSELVKDEVNGELFAPGDARDLRERLERVVREPERLDRYRAAVPKTKTMKQNIDEIEALYEDAIRARLSSPTVGVNP
jgi:glycosyltransferase involved in cell wall biosynthesis